MGDGVEVDDAGEESLLPVGLLSPLSDLLQDLRITSLRSAEARSVDQCDFHAIMLERVRLDLASIFFPSKFEPNYSGGYLTGMNTSAHFDLRVTSDLPDEVAFTCAYHLS